MAYLEVARHLRGRGPSPISPLSDSKVSVLKVMAEIFKTTFEEARDHEDEEPLPDMPPMAIPSDNQSEKKILTE